MFMLQPLEGQMLHNARGQGLACLHNPMSHSNILNCVNCVISVALAPPYTNAKIDSSCHIQ